MPIGVDMEDVNDAAELRKRSMDKLSRTPPSKEEIKKERVAVQLKIEKLEEMEREAAKAEQANGSRGDIMDQLLGRRRERLIIKKQEPPKERAPWRTGRGQSSSQSGSGADAGGHTCAAAAGAEWEDEQEAYHPTGPAAAANRRAPAGNLAGKWEKIKKPGRGHGPRRQGGGR